jgi:hypothetical protein
MQVVSNRVSVMRCEIASKEVRGATTKPFVGINKHGQTVDRTSRNDCQLCERECDDGRNNSRQKPFHKEPKTTSTKSTKIPHEKRVGKYWSLFLLNI